MRLVVGDETGLLKVVSVEDGRVVRTVGSQQRDYGVECMCWADARPEEDPTLVAAGLKNGTVLLFDAFDESRKPAVLGKPTGKSVRGVCAAGRGDSGGRLAVCSEEGDLSLYSAAPDALFGGDDDREDGGEPLRSFSVGKPVSVMRSNAAGAELAVGGKEHDLEVYDVETGQRSFQAKNVPDDKLRLRVPVWVADAAFVPGDPQLLALVSGHRHYRLYDRRKQRRPVVSVEVGDSPFTSLAVTPDARMAITGDASGTVRQLDLRTGKVAGHFKGEFAGAVRSVAIHPHASVVASACLDRFVRVHHSQTRTKILKLYLKQKLTGVLVSGEMPLPTQACPDPAERSRLEFWTPEGAKAYGKLKAAFARTKQGRAAAAAAAEGAAKRRRGREVDMDDENEGSEAEDEEGSEGAEDDPYAQLFGPAEAKAREKAAAMSAAAPVPRSRPADEAGEEDEEEEENDSGDAESSDGDEEGGEEEEDEEKEDSGEEDSEEEERPPAARAARAPRTRAGKGGAGAAGAPAPAPAPARKGAGGARAAPVPAPKPAPNQKKGAAPAPRQAGPAAMKGASKRR
eukprot:tig00020710_g13274.t1